MMHSMRFRSLKAMHFSNKLSGARLHLAVGVRRAQAHLRVDKGQGAARYWKALKPAAGVALGGKICRMQSEGLSAGASSSTRRLHTEAADPPAGRPATKVDA